jgi:hypothetical protein
MGKKLRIFPGDDGLEPRRRDEDAATDRDRGDTSREGRVHQRWHRQEFHTGSHEACITETGERNGLRR